MQENVKVNESTGDQDFTLVISDNNILTIESTMMVKSLGRCFNETIDREMSDFNDTVSKIESKMQF